MSYPNLPNNRLIVNGIDLTERYGLILVDGYTLEPPEPKTYTVDIPGGNGVIDLTNALSGDTVYKNRKQEFEFYVIDVKDFERVKTDVSNLLHGRDFDYKITMDPDYTYHGRFTVSSYTHSMYNIGKIGVIKVSIDADPYKYKSQRVIRADAVGGIIFDCPSGRMRVRPSIETGGFLRVIFKGKKYELPQGTWNINDILFEYGNNEIYFCSYDIRKYSWGDLKANKVTWSEFKTKRLFEWYKTDGGGNYITRQWYNVVDRTWGDVSDTSWSELRYSILESDPTKKSELKNWSDYTDKTWADISSSKWPDIDYILDDTVKVDSIYIAYDWGDL